MYQTITHYAAWPSLLKAGQVNEITVTATQRTFMFWEDKEYTVRINALFADVEDYHYAIHKTDLTVKGHKGILKFSHLFEGEGEYWIDISDDEKPLGSVHVYALQDDLYGLRPLKGDFHSNRYRSDGTEDPGMVASLFREYGYDFFVLTDHNRYYPGAELLDGYDGIPLGLHLIRGEEVHTPGSMVHLVHVGGTGSVAEIYVHDRPTYEKEYKAIEKELSDRIPAQYRARYAMAMWAADKIHSFGGIAVIAHPYWHHGGSHTYNITPEFLELLLNSGKFDAMEVGGGIGHIGINLTLARWQEWTAKGNAITIMGTSDIHGFNNRDFNTRYSVVFAKDNTTESILDALKAGLCVSVEGNNDPHLPEYRCYGSLRLVTYAQFLLNNYFTETRHIAEGEGPAMRRYLTGEENGELLSAMADRVDNYYRRYAGIDAPILPTDKMLERIEHWRDLQRNGPPTCSSYLLSGKKPHI